MGDHKINIASKGKERSEFVQHLLDDIECLEQMLREKQIEEGPIRIGAEQEFCVLNEDWYPSSKALEILQLINDDHFTTELALYNLEINLDPIELKANCFFDMMKSHLALLKKATKACQKTNTKPLLTGILPSISRRYIESEYMTPSPRYFALNEMMRKLRGSDFSLHIKGVDELTTIHESVLFEACNTSYQMHLQIKPEDFVSSYNWSQAITGPVMAITTNSPMLFGKELWSETRIALFQQSIDTRTVSKSIRQNSPRVTFGNDWIRDSVTDIYKDDITRFQLIISRDIVENSLEVLKNNKTPKLEALSLHNGTIYRWNRACYGVGNGIAHLRIENRYIPSGPTVIDEIANLAFWVGLMVGRPSEFDQIQEKMDFKDAKGNFIRAARTGKDSHMQWMGESISSTKLIKETLLPIAKVGLRKVGLGEDEISHFLDIIEQRTKSNTGSEWQISNFRLLRKKLNKGNALRVLCSEMYRNQSRNIPVSQWKDITLSPGKSANTVAKRVYEIMTTDLFTVNEDDPANLVTHMMKWKNIHHVPVENEKNELVGIITWRIMNEFFDKPYEELMSAKNIMISNVITENKNADIKDAEALMIRNKIGCLPIVKDKELIGIVTKKDLIFHGKNY